MSNPPRPKAQHYVPCFYLKNFIAENCRLWTYDNVKNEVRTSVPEKTAVETNFYSVRADTGEYLDDLDEWLQKIEDSAATLYVRVLAGETLIGDEKKILSLFFATLYTRSPAVVTACAELKGHVFQELMQNEISTRYDFEMSFDRYDAERGEKTACELRNEIFEILSNKSRYTVEVPKKGGLSALGSSEKIAAIFYRMTWSVLHSPRQHVITSDNPVVLAVPATNSRGSSSLFLDKRAEVSVPLSHDKVMLMTWTKQVSDHHSILDPTITRRLNKQRAFYAERYLYASVRDSGIQALGQKYKNPGWRIRVPDSGTMAPVRVTRSFKN